MIAVAVAASGATGCLQCRRTSAHLDSSRLIEEMPAQAKLAHGRRLSEVRSADSEGDEDGRKSIICLAVAGDAAVDGHGQNALQQELLEKLLVERDQPDGLSLDELVMQRTTSWRQVRRCRGLVGGPKRTQFPDGENAATISEKTKTSRVGRLRGRQTKQPATNSLPVGGDARAVVAAGGGGRDAAS